MNIRLKPIGEQVMVVVGASSGIGLVTAKEAARAGARVVLASRNARDLERAVESIRHAGGRAVWQVADVADPAQVHAIATTAIREFGRIDTWVNNAAVALYGRATDVPLADMRRQFDVNYWGQVHGSLVAVRHMRRAGGALINVASAVADRAIPLQGNYCAAKHALKAFTDTLRMELEEEGVPVMVTLVKPGSTNTPMFGKARTYLGFAPQPVPPVHAPDVVARAIIHCAQHPVRHVITGGMGKILSLAAHAPRLADRYMIRTTFDSQQTDTPVRERTDNLYLPVESDGGETGAFEGRTKGTSLYTAASLHPLATFLTLAGAGLGAMAASGMARGGRRGRRWWSG